MSTELDPLLRALGEVERDYDEKYPAVWEDVLAGRAPASAADERAAVDPEHPQFAAMFAAKIDDAEIQRLVAQAAASPAPQTAASPAPAAVVPLRRRVVIAVAAVLALAAALLLWQLPREGPRGPVIAYALTVRNPAVQPVRAADASAAVASYTRESTIDWVLSPDPAPGEHATPRDEHAALRVVARAPDGAETAVTPVFTRSAAGALRLRGRLGDVLPLAPGRWQLRFEVDGREVGSRLEISLTD